MRLLFTILGVLLLLSCGKDRAKSIGDVDFEVEEAAIIKIWKDWPNRTQDVNEDSAAYYWADDAMIMAQGQPTMKGKDQIKQLMSFMRKVPGFKMTWDEHPSDIQFSPDGQMAYLFAKNEFVRADSTGKEIKVVNQAMQIWKKDKDGNWRVSVVVMYPKMAIQSLF